MTGFMQFVLDSLSVGITYAVLALGLTLVFSVMNLVNFAYGLLLVWTAYCFFVFSNRNWPFWLSILAAIGSAVLLSLLMGYVAFRPFIGAPPITLLITSLGVLLVGQYIAILIFGERPAILQVPQYMSSNLNVGGLRIGVLQIVAIGCGAVVVGGFYGLLYRTPFGMHLRASAEQPETARLMAIKPDRILMAAFAVSGAIAGIAGLIWFMKAGAVMPRSDLDPTLKAFISLVLGGLGRISGSILGGLALGVIEVGLATFLPDGIQVYAPTIVFVIVILILIARPQGLAVRKGAVASR